MSSSDKFRTLGSSRGLDLIATRIRDRGLNVHMITKIWLDEFASGEGGYTRDQLDAIGISWPPKTGWKWRVIGYEISEADKHRFEMKRTAKEVRAHK